MSVALVNEATETVIVALAGATGATHMYDGIVTDKAVTGGASFTDGTITRPQRFTLSGVLSATGRTQADVEADKQAIVNAKAAATPISIQSAGLAAVPSMQIERCAFEQNRTLDRPFVIDFVERRVAQSRTVTLESIRTAGASDGGPRADVAPGVAEDVDLGTKPTSLFKGAFNSLSGLVQ